MIIATGQRRPRWGVAPACLLTAALSAAVWGDDPRVEILVAPPVEEPEPPPAVEPPPAIVHLPAPVLPPAPAQRGLPPALMAPARVPLAGPEPWTWLADVSEDSGMPVFATPDFMSSLETLPSGALHLGPGRGEQAPPPSRGEVLDLIAQLGGGVWRHAGGRIEVALAGQEVDPLYMSCLRQGTLRRSIERIAGHFGYALGSWNVGSVTEGYDLVVPREYYFLAGGTDAPEGFADIMRFFGASYGLLTRINNLDRTIDVGPSPGGLGEVVLREGQG